MPNVTVVEQDGIVAAGSDTTEQELRDTITVPEKKSEPKTEKKEPEPKAEATPQRREGEPDASPETHDATKKPRVERRMESIQADIDKLALERGKAQRELEQTRRELEQARSERAKLQTQNTTPTQTAPQPAQTVALTLRPDGSVPPFKEFLKAFGAANPNADYEDAIDAHAALSREAALKAFEVKAQQQQATTEFDQIVARHQERWNAAVKANPSLQQQVEHADAVLAEAGIDRLPPVMYHAVLRSERSVDLITDLVSHPDVMLSLAQMAAQQEPTLANANTMRLLLERSLSAGIASGSGPTPPLRHSRTNPPPKPVGSSPNASDDSDGEPSYEALKERLEKNVLHRRR